MLAGLSEFNIKEAALHHKLFLCARAAVSSTATSTVSRQGLHSCSETSAASLPICILLPALTASQVIQEALIQPPSPRSLSGDMPNVSPSDFTSHKQPKPSSAHRAHNLCSHTTNHQQITSPYTASPQHAHPYHLARPAKPPKPPSVPQFAAPLFTCNTLSNHTTKHSTQPDMVGSRMTMLAFTNI